MGCTDASPFSLTEFQIINLLDSQSVPIGLHWFSALQSLNEILALLCIFLNFDLFIFFSFF
jgi:hypothetical protein